MLVEDLAKKIFAVEVIKYDPTGDEANDLVVYRHEIEDFGNKTHVLVAPNQVAILMNEGEMIALPPGNHRMDESNNSWNKIANHFTRLLSNGVSYYHCLIYFVNVVHYQDLRFGTPSPIQTRDPEYGIQINVRANGLFGAHIDNDDQDGSGALRFFKNVVGTKGSYSKKELEAYLRGKIVERMNTLLSKTIVEQKVPILGITSHLEELSDSMLEQMKPYFADYGIKLTNFSFMSVNVPEEDIAVIREASAQRAKLTIESQGKAAEMNIMSEAMAAKRAREGYTYQQEKGFDVMKTAAGNEATPGMLMGAGMGVGMGLGVGGAMGGMMSNVATNTMGSMDPNTAQQQMQGNPAQGANGKTKICPKCGNSVPEGVKFCPNCGNKMAAVCPNCGAEIAPGSHFCSNCGQKLVSEKKHCPNCGKELPEGIKFCPNCGMKIE